MTLAFTIAVLPDTQVYAKLHPEHFDHQVDWILDNAAERKIAAALHEGDVVDDNSEHQWALAAAALRRLEGTVPLVLALGNHDYGEGGSGGDRFTRLHDHFPFDAMATVVATFEPGRADNALHAIETPGGGWHVLVLEFAPRPAAAEWGFAQLRQRQGTPAILLTHTYLYSDHTRYDRRRDDQSWAPWVYGVAKRPGGVLDGEDLYERLVLPCDDVRLVLCGHVLNEGTGLRTDERLSGSVVHQILANYQTGQDGGAAYLRLLEFHDGGARLLVRTYSPYLDRELFDPRNRFELSL